MTNANHVGDRNELVVGDNDHGDSTPTQTELDTLINRLLSLSHQAKKLADGILYNDHPHSADAIYGDCVERTADECVLAVKHIKQLRAERDEARRMYCGVDNCTADEAMLLAKEQGWDCYKKEETQ